MSKLSRLILTITMCLPYIPQLQAQVCEETPRRQIELALHNGNRPLMAELMSDYGDAGKQILVQLAGDPSHPNRAAIELLGEYRSDAGEKLLMGLLKSEYPHSCSAIWPLSRYRNAMIVPKLIELLDDRRQCGHEVQISLGGNEPAKSTEVFASDNAVEALEFVTGKSFEEQKDLFVIGHRATKPWKDWWSANRDAFFASPGKFFEQERKAPRRSDRVPCSVQSIAISPDSRTAFSSGTNYDPWVRAWDIQTRKQIWATPTFRDAEAEDSAFSPDGRVIAIGTENDQVKIFDARTGVCLRKVIFERRPGSIAFNPDGTFLAAATEDDKIHFLSTKTWCEINQIDNGDFSEGIAFSPDGSLLASATFEKARVWRISEGKEVGTFPVKPGKPPKSFADTGERNAQLWRMANKVAFSPDGKVLATGSSGAIQLWNSATGLEIASKKSHGDVESLYYSQDGQWVVWTNGSERIFKWNQTTGEVIRFKNEISMGQSALTNNGKFILSPGAGSEIAIFDFGSGKEVGNLSCEK